MVKSDKYTVVVDGVEIFSSYKYRKAKKVFNYIRRHCKGYEVMFYFGMFLCS